MTIQGSDEFWTLFDSCTEAEISYDSLGGRGRERAMERQHKRLGSFIAELERKAARWECAETYPGQVGDQLLELSDGTITREEFCEWIEKKIAEDKQ